jgi:lysophospholipase L1-like esterase
MKRFLAAVMAGVLAAGAAGAADEGFFFRDGDAPIVFLGDSITEQAMYTALVESYVLTRFPEWKVTFRNLGWSGDTMWLQRRGSFEEGMQRDVLPLKAKAMTVDFGMNDARGGDNNLPKYVEHATKLVRQLKAAGVRVALCTPSPEERYEPDQPAGSAYNRMLAKYSDALRKVATDEQVLFVDQFTPFVQAVEQGRKAGVLGAGGAPRLVPDAVHPSWPGQLVMAAAILKGLNAPALVSRAEIDAAAKQVVAAQNCTVELKGAADAGVLTFVRTDRALPWPIPPDATLALAIPGFNALDELSRYELKVTGLAAPRYELSIDGKTAAVLTREELAQGANLSLRAGLITAQAQLVLEKTRQKNQVFFERWRTVQLFTLPAWLRDTQVEEVLGVKIRSRLEVLDANIAEAEAGLAVLRRPAPHTFGLAPVTPP